MEKNDKNEILDAINTFANDTQEQFNDINRRFDGVDQRFNGVDQKFNGIDQKFNGIDQRFDKLEDKVTNISMNMVTKSYLDDKLADLEGGIIVREKKMDSRFKRLLEKFRQFNIFPKKDIDELDEINVFPKSTTIN